MILAARALIADPLDVEPDLRHRRCRCRRRADGDSCSGNPRRERLWEIVPLLLGVITLIGLVADGNPDLGLYVPALLIAAVAAGPGAGAAR